MPIIFWSIAALDAALFLLLLLSFSKQGASSSGGREMGMFFFVLVPCVVLLATALVFIFSRTDFWRYTALFIVAGPGLFIGCSLVRTAYIDYRVIQNRLGRGYFSSSAMKAMGAAVVKGDLEAMRRLAPKIDINTVAQPRKLPGMTLMRLAAENAFRKDSDKSSPEDVAVIKTLLELGAKPNPGLDAALRIKDAAILRVLLEAGADPNMKDGSGQFIIFSWLAVIPVEAVRLLAKHGLNLNATDHASPLCVVALFDDRWDIVSELIDLGADFRTPDDSGRTVPGQSKRQLAEAESEGRKPDPFLLEVRAKVLAREKRE